MTISNKVFSSILILSTVMISACSQAQQSPQENAQQEAGQVAQQATQANEGQSTCLEVSLTGTMAGPLFLMVWPAVELWLSTVPLTVVVVT